jgi:hypothetical protein
MKDIEEINPEEYQTIVASISKKYIDNKDYDYVQNFLNQMLEEPLGYANKVIIMIEGYDDDPRELFEIQEIRDYFSTLDRLFPYWFYFINRKKIDGYSTLSLIMLLLVPNKIIKLNNGKNSIEYDIEKFKEFMDIHFHYFNELTDKIGMSLEENKKITNEIFENFS